MAKEVLISVIVPVYNAEQYLAECLDSVLEQTYRNLEIILINDGSRDASGEICRQYRERDDRIILIEQENAGVSVARNRGIEQASGEYLMFVDADDMIAPWLCEEAFRNMEDCDVLMFQFETFCDSKKLNTAALPESARFEQLNRFSGADCMHTMFGINESVLTKIKLPSMCTKLYRRSFLNKYQVLCPPGVINGEDMLFNVQTYIQDPRICYLPMAGYFYRYNPSSAVHRYNPNCLENERRFYKELEDILDQKQLWDQYREDIAYQKVNGLLRVFSGDIFHRDNPKPEGEKKCDFFELIGKEGVCSQISVQQKNFGFAKRCVLIFAKNKWYYPLKTMYWMKNIVRRAGKEA